MFVFDLHKNLISSVVQTAPSPATSGGTLIVASGDGTSFPAAPFNCVVYPAGIFPNTLNAEIIRVNSRFNDTLSITRSQESSTARAIVVGDIISLVVTKRTLTDIEDACNTLDSGVTSLSTSITNLAPIDSPVFTTVITTPRLVTTGPILVTDGNVSSPSITFASDQTLGLYKTTGSVNVAINGTRELQVSSSGITTPNAVTSGSLAVSGNAVVGTLTANSFITSDGNIRFKDGLIQIYDTGYAATDVTAPWCALSTRNGILITSEPIVADDMPLGTITIASFTTADGNIRIKDGLIQIWDPGYYQYNSSTPWCALETNNGVISTSQPIAN